MASGIAGEAACSWLREGNTRGKEKKRAVGERRGRHGMAWHGLRFEMSHQLTQSARYIENAGG